MNLRDQVTALKLLRAWRHLFECPNCNCNGGVDAEFAHQLLKQTALFLDADETIMREAPTWALPHNHNSN